MSDELVPFWHTVLGDEEGAAVARSVSGGHLSQGSITEEFESALGSFFNVPHVVATTSGSASLFLAAKALGIGPGDEVIIPNRTFIATAHAVLLTGAQIVLVDVQPDRTIIDERDIQNKLTDRTAAILPVHLNGNAANMMAIRDIAAKKALVVLEDTAQALASQSPEGLLGTLSDAGCFSLGVTKLITTGQGGFVLTQNGAMAERMRRLRSHGVFNTFNSRYDEFGFNLKYTDLQASIGLVQLGKVPAKVRAHRQVYEYYREALAGLSFLRVLSVDIELGAVPLWVEAVVADRAHVLRLLEERGVQARPYTPNLSVSEHLGMHDDDEFPNSQFFATHGIFLPSGPNMPRGWLERVSSAFHDIAPLINAQLPAQAEKLYAAH